MSFFASQPSAVAPPSYSRTKVRPPPYKASEPIPTSSSTINTATSFSPVKSIIRVFTNSSASTSTAPAPLSTAQSIYSSTTASPSSVSIQTSVCLQDRDQPLPSIPPPTYSPIKPAPKPLVSPPAYSVNPEPRPLTGTSLRLDTFSTTRGQVIPGQSYGLAFHYGAEEWVARREREERQQFDEWDAGRKEDEGCCSWWWVAGRNPLPWEAFYIF